MTRFILSFALLLTSFTGLAARTKEERKTLFGNATKELKATGIEKKIPKAGETFPDLVLDGKTVSQWLKSGPLIVTFYRGGWCPYCVKQLKEINSGLTKLQSHKATLIAISPEKPIEVKKTKNKNDLKFPVISDDHNKLAKSLGLVFKVNEDVVSEYKLLGIDLEASQDNKSHELPIPATFVIQTNRKIVFAFADADYTKRASTDDIVNSLK
jgi:peroxiredoxin